MNKFKFYFILLITTVTIFSCSKDDDSYTDVPLRDYRVQYNLDITSIEKYLNSNYIDLKDPNYADKDPVIEKITNPATQPSLMSYTSNAYEGSTVFPQLWSKIVIQDGIEYKLYYLILRKGTGESPCNVDGVFTTYKGSYLYEDPATVTTPSEVKPVTFEEVTHPNTTFSLYETITGWGEVFPEFKKGSYTKDQTTGTITYTGFGAGIMFLPSGLAYYSTGSATIPPYTPLIFSFKLYDILRLDQDSDGIPSYLEDNNKDGYVRIFAKTDTRINPDDTDNDGLPNFIDIDDDGDNYTTRIETQYVHPLDPKKTIRYYPFNGALADDKITPYDDPTTPYVDESQGIPAYSEAGTPDYTNTNRLRIHLDVYHHTAKP